MPISVDELASQLVMLAMFWNDLKDAQLEDRLRREARAKDFGVSPSVLSAFTDSLHPPGVKYPLTNRQAGRRRKHKKPARRRSPWEFR